MTRTDLQPDAEHRHGHPMLRERRAAWCALARRCEFERGRPHHIALRQGGGGDNNKSAERSLIAHTTAFGLRSVGKRARSSVVVGICFEQACQPERLIAADGSDSDV